MEAIADSLELGTFQDVSTMIQAMVAAVAAPELDDDTWDKLFGILQEMERGYFAASAGPDGTPWLPLRPLTIAKKGHSIILRETYELEKSLVSVNASSIRINNGDKGWFGTNREWSWVHQEGSEKLNKQGTPLIPQRMFLGMNEDATDKIVDLVADNLVEQMFAAEW